jgi:hypothetical protein
MISYRAVKRSGDVTISFSDLEPFAVDVVIIDVAVGCSQGTSNEGFGIEIPALGFRLVMNIVMSIRYTQWVHLIQ